MTFNSLFNYILNRLIYNPNIHSVVAFLRKNESDDRGQIIHPNERLINYF